MTTTKRKIRFQYGDVVEFRPEMGTFSANIGALAQVVGYQTRNDNPRKEFLRVVWIKGHRGQSDGNYYPSDFTLLVRPKI